jgi:putative hemolysin
MVWPDILIILSMVVLNGFFAMSELAVVSSRRGRLQQYALEHRRGAASALVLVDDSASFLAAVQIGITLIAILAGAYGEAALADPLAKVLEPLPYVGPQASAVSTAIVIVSLTYISLIIGELVPKRLALRNPEPVACFVAPLMLFLSRAAYPAIWLLPRTPDLVLRLFSPPAIDDPRVTEEEVKTLIAEGTEAGVFEQA